MSKPLQISFNFQHKSTSKRIAKDKLQTLLECPLKANIKDGCKVPVNDNSKHYNDIKIDNSVQVSLTDYAFY